MNAVSIFRAPHTKERPFVMISKQMFRDKNLSVSTKGILGYLLTLPDNWKVHPLQVAGTLGIGKDKIYKSINELIKHGYAKREYILEKGKRVACEYQFFEEPIFLNNNKNNDLRNPEKPDLEKPDLENKDIKDTDSKQTDKKDIYKKDIYPPRKIVGKSESVPNTPLPPKGGESTAVAAGLSLFFLATLQKISPTMKNPSIVSWNKQFDLMLRIDKRTESDIRKVILFILEHHEKATTEFTWAKAIRSPEKLRKHFDTVMLQISHKPVNQKSGVDEKTIADRRTAMVEHYSKYKYLFSKNSIEHEVHEKGVVVGNDRIYFNDPKYVELLNHAMQKVKGKMQ